MEIRKFIISGLLAVSVVGCGIFGGCSDQNETSSSTPPVADQTLKTTEEEMGMSGIVLMSAQITADEYETYGVSEDALKAYTLTATYAPSYVTNAAVDWGVSFVDPESEWATGKTATDYITVTPETDGALSAVVACFAAFGADIQVTVTSRTNPDVYANCICLWVHTGSGETGGSTGGGEEGGTGTTDPETPDPDPTDPETPDPETPDPDPTDPTDPDTGETGGSTGGSEGVSVSFDISDLAAMGTDTSNLQQGGVTLQFSQNTSTMTAPSDTHVSDGYITYYKGQQLTFSSSDAGGLIQKIVITLVGIQSDSKMTCDMGSMSLSENSDNTTTVIIDMGESGVSSVTVTFDGSVRVCGLSVVTV